MEIKGERRGELLLSSSKHGQMRIEIEIEIINRIPSEVPPHVTMTLTLHFYTRHLYKWNHTLLTFLEGSKWIGTCRLASLTADDLSLFPVCIRHCHFSHARMTFLTLSFRLHFLHCKPCDSGAKQANTLRCVDVCGGAVLIMCQAIPVPCLKLPEEDSDEEKKKSKKRQRFARNVCGSFCWRNRLSVLYCKLSSEAGSPDSDGHLLVLASLVYLPEIRVVCCCFFIYLS